MEKFIKILIITVIIGFIGYFAYNKIINWHKTELASAISQERNKFEEKTWELEKEIRELENELVLNKKTLIPKEKLTEVFPWGTIKIPSTKNNIEKAMSLSEVEIEEIKSRTNLYLKYYGYESIL